MSDTVSVSHDLARTLIGLADKGFTGVLDCATEGRQVRVFVEHGLISAVTSPQCPFPAAQLARTATGHVMPAEADPVAFLIEEAHFDAPRVAALVQDWSYALAAAVLTWPRVKLTKRRRVAADGPSMAPVPARAFVQALQDRLDLAERTWATVRGHLVAAGWAPPQGTDQPCTVLAVSVAGRDHLRGDAPVDELAFRNGRTRMSVLEHLAGVLDTARDAHDEVGFRSVQPAGDLPAVTVPEQLETGTPVAPLEAARPGASAAVSTGAGATTGAAMAAPIDDAHVDRATIGVDAVDDTPDADLPSWTVQPGVDEQSPLPRIPRQYSSAPLSRPIPVVEALAGTGSALMDAWVHAATAPAEQDARAQVLDSVRHTALDLAHRRVEDLGRLVADLRSAGLVLGERRAGEQHARGRLQAATEEMVRAEHQVIVIEREGAEIAAARDRAHEEQARSWSALEAARSQVDDLRAMLERAEAEAERAHQVAASAEVGRAVAEEQYRQEVELRLVEARRAIEQVRAEQLDPAEQHLATEQRRVADARDAVREHRTRAWDMLDAVSTQVRVVGDLVPDGTEEQALTRQLAELTAAVESVSAEQPGGEGMTVAGTVDETQRSSHCSTEGDGPAPERAAPLLRAVPAI